MASWATASEQNSKEFIIERSSDAKNFSPIGVMQAAGNSNHTTHYHYTDYNATKLISKEVSYRLKQVDLDGKFMYSSIVNIPLKQNNGEFLVTAYPNPFTQNITLQLSESALGTTDKVEMYSSEGRLVYQRSLSNTNATMVLLNDLPVLSKGVYVLKGFVNGKPFVLKMIRTE